MTINELQSGGAFGSNLANSTDFTYSIENNAKGFPRILKIQESASSLAHRTWYAIRNTGSWADVENFKIDIVVQRGDANDNQTVEIADADLIYGGLCVVDCGDDRRTDINGNLTVTTADAGLVYSYQPSNAVSKPTGH